MDDEIRQRILAIARTAHSLTEKSYQANTATIGDPGWSEKQRTLLADMAIHLLQTWLKDGELSVEDLKRNLFSILTISDQFIPDRGLKAFADDIYSS